MKRNQKPKNSKKQNKSETIKMVLLVILLIACLVASAIMFYLADKKSEEKELAYTDLIESINILFNISIISTLLVFIDSICSFILMYFERYSFGGVYLC